MYSISLVDRATTIGNLDNQITAPLTTVKTNSIFFSYHDHLQNLNQHNP